MAIQAIQTNDNNSSLATVVKASAVGALTGYATKYVLPITNQEKDATYINELKRIRAYSKDVKAEIINEIKTLTNRSKAQDEFLKFIDADKKAYKEKIKTLGGIDSADAIEFKNIIEKINDAASKKAGTYITLYKNYLKRIRPTAPFIVAGALTGLFAGATHNVLKTDKTNYLA